MPQEKQETATATTTAKPTIPDAKSVWRGVLGNLQLNLSQYMYKTWVEKCSLKNFTENTVELTGPNEHTLGQVKKIEPMIKEIIESITKQVYEIKYVEEKVKTTSKAAVSKKSKNINEPTEEAPLFEGAKKTQKAQQASGLCPDFTFENYIVGESNQLAYSMAVNISKNPGKDYNPLFLYSGVGLGKTHLVQAIGNYIVKTKPNFKVIYTTGEAFTNELITIIQHGKGNKKYETAQFRKKYRGTDVLIIDDVQFIIGKEVTQKEFFHTFNELHINKRQIILTSDKPPKDFVNLEERLTSRFGSGVTADIQHADMELRSAILRARRDEEGAAISNDVLDFIAERVATNIRELKGAYLQVKTRAEAGNITPDVEFAAEVLGQVLPRKRHQPANPNTIMSAVCRYFQVNKADIKGRRRTKKVVVPRQVAMYLLQEMTETPLEDIGELLGGRDHTTVMHGRDKVANLIAEEPRTRQDIQNIRDLIYTG